MGVFNFLKKKETDIPMITPPSGMNSNTDIPTMSMKMTNDSSTLEDLPTFDSLPQELEDGPKTMSVTVPALDFSMPDPDGMEYAPTTQNAPDLEPLPSLDAPSAPASPQTQPIDLEDLNKLFITDDDWKEPDWKTFDPYPEEKIDEPVPEDFKGADLPSFEDAVGPAQVQNDASDDIPTFNPMISSTDDKSPAISSRPSQLNPFADNSVIEPDDSFEEQPKPVGRPMELFIRNRSYGKVFTELNSMNKTLSKMDGRSGAYDELLKSEEALLISAKDQMEQIYKKLTQVDKKIFIQ